MEAVKRATADGPWCWQSKAVRRKIREAFDATHNFTSAIAVYDALTEIASDAGSETFTTTHAWIQRFSGASVRTVQAHLGVFAELGIVKVSTPRLRAPSTYTLLSFGNGCATSGNDSVSNGNRCATFGNGPFRAPLPTSEERSEERSEEKKKKEPAAPGSFDELRRHDPSVNKAWVDYENRHELYLRVNLLKLRTAFKTAKEILAKNGRDKLLAWLTSFEPPAVTAGRSV